MLLREGILVNKLTKQSPLTLQTDRMSKDLLTDLSGLESKESPKKKNLLVFLMYRMLLELRPLTVGKTAIIFNLCQGTAGISTRTYTEISEISVWI